MALPTHLFKSEYAEELREEGREEGRGEGLEQGRRDELAEMIFALFDSRGITVSAQMWGRIKMGDLTQLRRWSRRAIEAERAEDIFD